MASRQSKALAKLYQDWLRLPGKNPDWTADDLRQMNEGWQVLTTEPGGVDYLEVDAGGVPAMWAHPKGAREDRVLLSIHGGGYVGGSMYTHRKMFAHLAKALGARALIVDYRLLPHPMPVDDALTAYRWLLEQGINPEHIAVTGDSAGGGLSLTTQLRARDQGRPLPAATMLISPWVDLDVTGETMVTNQGKDALFNKAWVEGLAATFLNGTHPHDPYASPMYADLSGLGPIYIHVGDQELLLDESRELARRAEQAGVDVRLDIFPEQQHTFHMMAGYAPEADDAIRRFADWVRPKLGLSDAAA
jgi:acetyl esterase/lipase